MGEYRLLYRKEESTLYLRRFRLLYMQLSERIQKVIDEQRIDQPSLAKVAGVTKATVNQLLMGKIKSLKMEYAVRIQERYGYSTAWLVLGRGPERVSDWPFATIDKKEFVELPEALKVEIEHHIQYVIHRWKSESSSNTQSAA